VKNAIIESRYKNFDDFFAAVKKERNKGIGHSELEYVKDNERFKLDFKVHDTIFETVIIQMIESGFYNGASNGNEVSFPCEDVRCSIKKQKEKIWKGVGEIFKIERFSVLKNVCRRMFR